MSARKPHPLALLLSLATALTLTALAPPAFAQSEPPGRDDVTRSTTPRMTEQERLRSGNKIFGSTLMKRQERTEHREKLRAMTTNEERDAYLQEHRLKMQERARQRGLWLPGMPRTKSDDRDLHNQ